MSSNNAVKKEDIKVSEWAGKMGEKWLANLDHFENMIAPVAAAAMERAGFRSGETVIDVGCGGGASSIEIASYVAPEGAVLGLDISPHLIAAATEEAKAKGLVNLEFTTADAATVTLHEAPFDRLFSRFGSMFFDQPQMAFANMKRMLRKGGRADFAFWAPASDNPWMSGTTAVARRHLDLPPPVPRAPGPFALDDPDYIHKLLSGAGFTGIDIQAWSGHHTIGGPGLNLEEAINFSYKAMAVGPLMADKSPELQAIVRQEITELFSRHLVEGSVVMPAKAWLVVARS